MRSSYFQELKNYVRLKISLFVAPPQPETDLYNTSTVDIVVRMEVPGIASLVTIKPNHSIRSCHAIFLESSLGNARVYVVVAVDTRIECKFIYVLFLDLMCLHFTRASLVPSCVRRLSRHVRAHVNIALAPGYHTWKRMARRIATLPLTRSPPAQYV